MAPTPLFRGMDPAPAGSLTHHRAVRQDPVPRPAAPRGRPSGPRIGPGRRSARRGTTSSTHRRPEDRVMSLLPRRGRVAVPLVAAALALTAVTTPPASSGPPPHGGPAATLVAAGLGGGLGSTVGPDGALYVTEGKAGRVARV